MRLVSCGAADDITAVFNSMELLQILSPQPIGGSLQGSFGGGTSRTASFSAIQEQAPPAPAGPLDPTAPFATAAFAPPPREAGRGFGVPANVLNSESLRRLSANSASSCAQPSAASGSQQSAASGTSVPPASASPGAGGSGPSLPMLPSDLPALTPEEVVALLDSGHIDVVGNMPACGAGGAIDGNASSTADRSRRDWYALVQTMAALSSQLAVQGPSMREKRAALVLFYQDALPRLAGLGPVGQLAQQRLAVMMAEVGLAQNPRRPQSEAMSMDELASGLSSGGLSGANALVGLPDEDGFLDIVGQGLSAVRRYASSAIVSPANERFGSSLKPPPPTWFGAGPAIGLAVARPGSPEFGAASLPGEVRPKLHACKNCQRAKTACMDQRPCARCIRLCLTCDDDHKTVRRACANCKRAKVRCNLGDGHPCARCIRLHLECTEHAKSKKNRPGAGGGSGDEDVASPVRGPACGFTSGAEGYSLPPLSAASSSSPGGMAAYSEAGAASGGAAMPNCSLGGGMLRGGLVYSGGGGGADMPMQDLRGGGPSVGFIFGDLVQEISEVGAARRDTGVGNGIPPATYTPRVE
jgi:hypothetical protein